MKITPILAENYGPWSFLMVVIPSCLILLTILCIPLNAKWGRRRWWGLVIGLIPTIGGVLFLYYFLPHNFRDSSDGPGIIFIVTKHPFLYTFFSIPFLCGVFSLYLWSRAEEE